VEFNHASHSYTNNVKESLFGGQIWQSGAFMIIYTGICEILLGLLNYILERNIG
jgi:hypothetical protein